MLSRFAKNNHQNLNSGFTLIEILVVIGIIALVIAIATASFSSTRSRANDGKIQQELGLMRLEAERSYKTNKNSTNVCNDTGSMVSNLPGGTTF